MTGAAISAHLRRCADVAAAPRTRRVLEVGVALGVQHGARLRVDLGEDPRRGRIGHVDAELAQLGGELVGLGLHRVEEVVVGVLVPDQVHPHPLDRVLQLPRLQLVGEPVARRVVGRGVCVHAVGERLDQDRAVAVAALVERPAGHRERREHVVAVDADAGEAVAAGALVERQPGLAFGGLGDGPLVVLAEEHERRVVHRRPHEALVHVALRGGAVAEVDDRGLAVVVADLALEALAHGVAGGVQHLVADDDRVQVEALLDRVPRAVVGAAEDAEQLGRVHAAAPRDAVLAVARERHVVRFQSLCRSRSARPPGRAAAPRCRAGPGAAARWPPGRRAW